MPSNRLRLQRARLNNMNAQRSVRRVLKRALKRLPERMDAFAFVGPTALSKERAEYFGHHFKKFPVHILYLDTI